jgi:NADH-quinone oxidoreductase subunit J
MVAAVLLTYRKRTGNKAVDPATQIAVKAADRLRIVKMASEKDLPATDATQASQGE